MGTVNEKASTPTDPIARPERAGSGAAAPAIALLSYLMFDDSSAAISEQLRRELSEAAPGSRLPSTRSLAQRFGAGPVTVQKAIGRLVASGLVETRPGVGNFVLRSPSARGAGDVDWQTTSLGPDRTGPTPVGSTLRDVGPGTIALHSGYPSPDLVPLREVRSALQRAIRENPWDRPPLVGVADLRAWFAREAAPGLASAAPRPTDVVVTAGGQAALSAVFRALAAPGEAVVMESPTYWGAISAARQAGLVIVPVARGAGAPRVADMDEALRASGARIAYVQPTFANPTGAHWLPEERAAIMRVAADRGVFLVEDDWARDLAIAEPRPPLVADDPDGHVVYIRSLTKSASLALRVGAVIARGPVRDRIAGALASSDLYVSPVLQHAALDVVTRPSWQTHLARLRRELRVRRDALAAAVSAHAPSLTVASVPDGGLNLWARLPQDLDAQGVAARCLAEGVAVSPGDEWFPASVPGPHLRLNYGWADPAQFPEAARIIERVVGGSAVHERAAGATE
ncbi:PLP-dependent aminotransferase family protein [Williamsia deligens]